MTRRKMMRIVLSICLVAVVAVGSTLAYLSAVTNKVTNVFSFSENITAELEEPGWTGGEDKNDNGIPDAAENMVPGSEVPKDPQIVNTSAIDEYVAIKLTFQDGLGTALDTDEMTKLMTLIEIHYNNAAGFNSDWALVNSTDAGKTVQTWYYKKLVAAKATPADPLSTTAPLFDKVVIKNTITGEDITWLKDTLKGFQIYIEGAAVQASVFEDPSAVPALTEAQKASNAANDPDAGLYYLLNGANP